MEWFTGITLDLEEKVTEKQLTGVRYRGYLRMGTHTALGSYGRAMSRIIGPP
jgi:hypothetical protein